MTTKVPLSLHPFCGSVDPPSATEKQTVRDPGEVDVKQLLAKPVSNDQTDLLAKPIRLRNQSHY